MHCKQIGTGRNEPNGIFRCNPTDGNDGLGDDRGRLNQYVNTACGSIGLGSRRKEAAEGDIIRAFIYRRNCASERVITGYADDDLGSQNAPGRWQGRVVLAKVNAICMDRISQVDIVIDDQRNAIFAAKQPQSRCPFQAFSTVVEFIPVLNGDGAARQGRRHHRFELLKVRDRRERQYI